MQAKGVNSVAGGGVCVRVRLRFSGLSRKGHAATQICCQIGGYRRDLL